MRSCLSASLLTAIALLATGAAPSALEAQRTGTAGRGGAGTATGWVGGSGRAGVRPAPPSRGRPSDRWGRRNDGYLRYGRSIHPTPYVRPRSYPYSAYDWPLVVYLPSASTRSVYVQTEVAQPRTIAGAPAAQVAPALESCAVVTVLQPDRRGYWKEVRFPVAGAHNTDELQRILDARIEEGAPFTLRDADGETIDIPAGAALDRVIVDSCR